MVLSSSSDINNTASSSSNGGGGTATGAFSFLWGTEARGGFMHLDLYTFVPQPASSKGEETKRERMVRAAGGWLAISIPYPSQQLPPPSPKHTRPYPYTDPPTSVLFQQQPLARRLRAVSGGPWVVESIAGVDEERNLVFVTGGWIMCVYVCVRVHIHIKPNRSPHPSIPSTPPSLPLPAPHHRHLRLPPRAPPLRPAPPPPPFLIK